MKCKDCSYCEKGWYKSAPNEYVCIGTKEPFVIMNVDSECTVYPEPNHTNVSYNDTMNTAEMWIKAQKDGKTYECVDGDMAYSKKYGLTEKTDFNFEWGLEAWEDDGANGLDCLMTCKWKEMHNVMTIEEAEKKFGIRIVSK